MSNFTFFHRPEARKYTYKPQFYDPDKPDEKEVPASDSEAARAREFANHMHDSWDRRRQHKNQRQSSQKTILWLLFIFTVLVVLFLYINRFFT